MSNLKFFTFDTIKTSFPLFKKLISKKINIIYEMNKYHYYCKFDFNEEELNLDFFFDNLKYITHELFSKTNEISITNSLINEFIDLSKDNLPNLNKLNLKNNTIEGMKIFSEIKKRKKYFISLVSEKNICKNFLLDSFDKNLFEMEKISLKDNYIQIDYCEPFNFYILITKKKLNELKFFKGCKIIDIQNFNLTNDDINFLKNDSFADLKKINLDGNEITNLDFLDTINSSILNKISIKNNPINEGIVYINKNLAKIKIKTLRVRINNDKHILSLYYKYGNHELFFDFLIEISKNLDILENINLKILKLNLSNIKLKKINFLLNNSFNKINYLNLDSNEIEDINILSNKKLGILNAGKVSIKNNPIKIGLNALVNGIFFDRIIFIELSIAKIGKEYKISAYYNYPRIYIDFFINNINEIKNYFDFKNKFIQLNNNYHIDEAKMIEDEIKKNENLKQFKTMLSILNNKEKDKNNHELIISFENNNKEKKIINYNEIIINDGNIKSFENVFKILSNKSNYLKLFSYISNLTIKNFTSKGEKIIQYLPFHYLDSLTLFNCNFNLNVLQHKKFKYLKKLDLSHSSFTDIKIFCGELPFYNKLEVLNLSNNNSISNLYELKNAKFNNLKELYLSNIIPFLGDIKIKFRHLKVFFLKENSIMKEEDEENQLNYTHMIIDKSANYIKAGLNIEEEPKVKFPLFFCLNNNNREYFGKEAYKIKSICKLQSPIENDFEFNWDLIEKIWDHCIIQSGVDPVEYKFMISEPPMNSKINREKIAQIMFETFNVPGLYIVNQAVLSLINAGKFTGIAIDSGECYTHFVPIFECFSLPHATIQLDLANKNITEYMFKLLLEEKIYFPFYNTTPSPSLSDKEIAKSIIKKACYVALDYEEEKKFVKSFEYELPDGSFIEINKQRITCPEILFNPKMIGKERLGFGRICYDSIQKCDIDIRKDLYNSIVISGGYFLFNGLSKRLEKEIKNLAPKSMKKEVKVFPDDEFAIWKGGSILSSLSTFEPMWITKTEYEEEGFIIVHRKCF